MVNRQKNMDSSSKLYGDHEECQSSESGWTMYIGSSMDDDDNDNDGGGVYDHRGGRQKGILKNDGDDEDTDDSMTSDASSGPSHLHLQQPWDVQQNDQQNNNQEKYKSSSKKNKKGKKKGGYDGQDSRKKDESLVKEKRGVITTVQSGNRAWFLGKRK